MSQQHNQPTSARQGVISNPTDGRQNDNNAPFYTGDFKLIGRHEGWTVAAYSNIDGSHGFLINDGSSCIWIDETKTIHIQTGADGNDGVGSGGLTIACEDEIHKTKTFNLEVEGNGDEEKTTTKGTSNKPPYSIVVYGDISMVSKGGDIKLAADNILLNAKEQVKIKSGAQTIINAADGGGKVDIVAGEVTTNASTAKFDLTGSFYVDGPEEITFNQKFKVNLASGEVNVNTLGAVVATNTLGGRSDIITGTEKHTVVGNFQVETNKLLSTTLFGDAKLSLGPFVDYTIGQYEGKFVGVPTANSRTTNAYELLTGGTIGTSYRLASMDTNMFSLGTITGTTVGVTDFIGVVILLN